MLSALEVLTRAFIRNKKNLGSINNELAQHHYLTVVLILLAIDR